MLTKNYNEVKRFFNNSCLLVIVNAEMSNNIMIINKILFPRLRHL